MKKAWLRVLCLCALTVALAACGEESAAPAPPETTAEAAVIVSASPVPAPEPESAAPELLSAVEAQAFSAAMAAHIGGYDTPEAPDMSLFYWDMAGWYAAREYRINGYELLPAAQIEDFLRSVGYTGPLELPESWQEYEVAQFRSSPEGVYYAFPQHCREIDAMLGVTTEVRTQALGDDAVAATVVTHYDTGAAVSRRYVLTFERNEDSQSAFFYQLTGIERPPAGAEMVGELSFTWEELLAANRLSSVFSIYPTVRHYCLEYNSDMVT